MEDIVYVCDDFSSLNEIGLKKLESIVTTERISKANEYKNKIDKICSLVAYALLEYALKCNSDWKFDKDKKFSYTKSGKPYYSDCELFFNLSHCACGVACAISEQPIGVDIQEYREVTQRLTNYVMSENEKKLIYNSKDFFKFWTMKEAFLKATDSGVNTQMKKLDFSSVALANTTYYDYHLTTFVCDNYAISVCGKNENVNIIKISINDLLDNKF